MRRDAQLLSPKTCTVCTASYVRGHRTLEQWSQSKTCSAECYHKSRAGIERTFTPEWIENIKKAIQPTIRRGKHHWNWQGGRTEENVRLRNTTEYHEWRKAVYARDYWTCKMCHVKQKHPIAHHLKSFRHYPSLRFDVENGQTLCRSCHKITHSEIGIETRFVAA